MSKSFTVAEVAKHKDDKDGVYIIIDSAVYDITGKHPLRRCRVDLVSLLRTEPFLPQAS